MTRLDYPSASTSGSGQKARSLRAQARLRGYREFPDAWSVAGRYQAIPQGLNVDVRMFRNNEPKGSLKLTLTGDENQQVEQLFNAVMKRMERETRH